MSIEHHNAARLDELESRIAYQDATIDKLNDVVCAQWAMIDRLTQQMERLEQRVQQVAEREGAEQPAELPPHY